MNVADRTLAAEARAVAEGHRAYLNGDGTLRVVSDTKPGKHYTVRATCGMDEGAGAIFTCDPVGNAAYADDHLHTTSREPGHTPCKHAAVAARRLEREGLLRWDAGRWVATAKVADVARTAAQANQPDDPFEGLPR